jgi:glycosyl transferase, family 25
MDQGNTKIDLQTWVINLDRAPDRLARITEQLQGLKLPFTRLAAVDARAMTAEQQALLDAPSYCQKHGMTPLLGELGCYLSHVAVMHAFLQSTAAFALVLEDDVVLHNSLPSVLSGLLSHPKRWDMVKLSGVHSGTPVRVLKIAPGHDLAVMLSRCTGSSAYLINRRAAQAYVAGLLPMSLPYDHVFDQGWRFRLKVRLVTPTPCGHDSEIASTIVATPGAPGSAGVSRKFHWTQRGSAHRYRLGNEWARLRYGLMSWWLESRTGGL